MYKLITSSMHQSIEIISEYPDLGRCIHHWEQITNVCCEKQCSNTREGFYCQKCQPFHSDHRTKPANQFVMDLAKKIVSIQSPDKGNKSSLEKTFKSIKQISKQFQEGIRSINELLSQINIRKIFIFEEALKCSQKQMYDKLCEWDLSENMSAFKRTSQTLDKFKFNHAGAPAFYQNQLKKLKSMVGKFNERVQNLMDEALIISNAFNFQQCIKQIDKYAPSKIKEQASIKPPSVVNRNQINLLNKDLIGRQIIQKLKEDYSVNLKELNLHGNVLDPESVQSIFNSSQFVFPNLERLILSSCFLNDDCITILLNSETVPALKYLKISDNQFESFTSEIIDKIKAKWPGINLVA